MKTPTSAALVLGSAFHTAVEDYITAKATSGKAASLAHFWPAALDEQLTSERNAVVDYGNETPESIDATGKRMLKNKDVAAVIDSIKPMTGVPFEVWSGESAGAMIERKITLNVPGVPVPIIGYIDIVADDGVPIDLKTAARMWPKGKEATELQPNVYLAGLNQMGWDFPAKFRYLIITKAKTPRVELRETARTPAELLWIFGLIKDVYDAIQAEAFPPSGVGSWKCSPKYCEFFSSCRGA